MKLPSQKGQKYEWRRSEGAQHRGCGREGLGSLEEKGRFRRRERNSLCPLTSPGQFCVTGSIGGSLCYHRPHTHSSTALGSSPPHYLPPSPILLSSSISLFRLSSDTTVLFLGQDMSV